MIVVMRPGASELEIAEVSRRLAGFGFKPHPIYGEHHTVIGAVGNGHLPDVEALESLAGVERVVRIMHPFKLVNRAVNPQGSIVRIGPVAVGGEEVIVVAGPCAVESWEQLIDTARAVKAAGASILRGGAFKPRTSPYSFQGLGEEALRLLAAARAETGLPVVTEVLSVRQVELVATYADALQIGARNMQNFELLREVGRQPKPVLLKRGLSATIEEWLMAAEYVASEGNQQIVLVERGIRTFENATRSTLDVSAVVVARELTHLPILVDPSHAAGRREWVAALSRAGMAAGADGLMIEVHPDPRAALSDGPQALTPAMFAELMATLRPLATALGRSLSPPGPEDRLASNAAVTGGG
ncbi:MAG TPA: 3-deoxy-7-phosphoheptulonate synthase [Firmicutes bacterium]|nr:3-deoxy-7-phosphoheptulonate synthase [Bacillota bacterium]